MKLPAFLRRWFIQPPADIVQAFNAVNSRMTYVYYKSRTKSLNDLEPRDVTDTVIAFVGAFSVFLAECRPPTLKEKYGNCVAYAKAYKKEANRGRLTLFKLWNGDWHCVLDVEDNGNTWRLDCRKRAVALV